MCKYGHVNFGSRADGRCATCHLERNQRYRKTDKGIARDARYEASRQGTRLEYYQAVNSTPQRWYSNFKTVLVRRINGKRQMLSELEQTINGNI